MTSFRMKLIGVLLATLALLFPFASANAEDWGTAYDKLFQMGADGVKEYKDKDGSEVREVISQGGVQIRQQRKDGQVSTTTVDVLHGPVLCFWEIAVTVRAALQTCEETNRPDLAKRLDTTIAKLNRFILANALEKATDAQMKAAMDARLQNFRKGLSAPAEGRVSCAKGGQGTLKFINSYLDDVAKKSDQDYQAGIDKLLSVPRLPAMNPCL